MEVIDHGTVTGLECDVMAPGQLSGLQPVGRGDERRTPRLRRGASVERRRVSPLRRPVGGGKRRHGPPGAGGVMIPASFDYVRLNATGVRA